MKRALGIFLIVQALLTYQIMNMLYDRYKIREEMIDWNTGVTTVSYNIPWIYSLSYIIPIIMFIFGIYFILAKNWSISSTSG
ncbi:hypothetical protein V7138_19345 [Bacillus sp. JJ1533]|uniref:hypothetical protein n=1 Tax=Bacillus sp. JJ1533 TaxID=3122959 RepID=UPI002FFECE7D